MSAYQKVEDNNDNLPVWLRPAFLVASVCLLTCWRLWVGAQTNLVEDEAYYRLWGLYPALGYYDHPPMIGWWIWIGQRLCGDTALAVRLLVILSSMVGSLFLWRTTAILFGKMAAGWSVLLLNASLLVGIGGVLATPDAPSVLFWGMTLWALAELHVSQKPFWWLLVGLCAGLGLVSKYSVLFLGVGIILWLVFVPSARKWWGYWQLWLGGLLAIVCFAPVLWWNHLHDWVSFYKQFGRTGEGVWTTKYVFEFLGALLGLLNPFIALLALGGSYRFYCRMRAGQGGEALVLLTVVPFLTYLLFHSLHDRVQGNWPSPLFPSFAIMAAVFVAGSGEKTKLFAKVGVITGLVLGVVIQGHGVSAFTGVFARKDPTFQLRGWNEVADQVGILAQETGANYIATSRFGVNGQLAFALRASPWPVFQFNERIRYVMMPAPASQLLSGKGLYVSTNRRDDSAWLRTRFDEVKLIAKFPRTVRQVSLEDIVVYELTGPRAVILDPLNDF